MRLRARTVVDMAQGADPLHQTHFERTRFRYLAACLAAIAGPRAIATDHIGQLHAGVVGNVPRSLVGWARSSDVMLGQRL
jgi:hypothetical protein